jgi:hypothetical protein
VDPRYRIPTAKPSGFGVFLPSETLSVGYVSKGSIEPLSSVVSEDSLVTSPGTDPEREDLVFGHRIDWETTSAVKFEGLSTTTARELLDAGYVDPEASCGASPTMEEMVAFMERYGESAPESAGEMSAHGRMLAPDRPDGGVVIEGLKYLGPTSDEFIREFAALFYEAESFMLEKDLHGRCWFA